MSLKDKAQYLADLQKRVPKKLEARMDDAIARLSALEKKDQTVFDPLSSQLDEHEAGIKEVEEAVAVIERGVNEERPTIKPTASLKISDEGSVSPASMPKAGQLSAIRPDETVPGSPQNEMIKKASNG